MRCRRGAEEVREFIGPGRARDRGRGQRIEERGVAPIGSRHLRLLAYLRRIQAIACGVEENRLPAADEKYSRQAGRQLDQKGTPQAAVLYHGAAPTDAAPLHWRGRKKPALRVVLVNEYGATAEREIDILQIVRFRGPNTARC